MGSERATRHCVGEPQSPPAPQRGSLSLIPVVRLRYRSATASGDGLALAHRLVCKYVAYEHAQREDVLEFRSRSAFVTG